MRNATLEGVRKIGSSHFELRKSRTCKQWERERCRQQMATMSSMKRSIAAKRVTAGLPLHIASQNEITPF